MVLAAPVRTPIGKFGGALAPLSAADLGTAAATSCLRRAELDPGAIDQVVFGHGRQAGGGPNTARQIAHRSGVPVERPAFTVNQACGSGLQAILCGARAITLGEARVVLAGGTESMSNTPHLLPQARWMPDYMRQAMLYMNVNTQFETFGKGLLVVGNVVYFISGAALFLFLAIKVLESRRWR